MDPLRTAYLNEETPRQLHDRLRLYRAHNVKFVEYFADGTCRELERTDPLDFVLLAKTAFPHIQLPQVQQLMNTLRYFLFDLQNSLRELPPHYGPDQTLSNMVFYRPYIDSFGIILPVQVSNYTKFQLPHGLRDQLAQTPLDSEVQLQQNFVATGNAYYLDGVINRVIFNFRRQIREIEMQHAMQAPPVKPFKYVRNRPKRRHHWSMVP
ncbi:hypothetical protein C8R43DRAFT_943372 [Mycena crocata]|nr:hypothetical protein C8R43DRAFT_943372 [Mycena crocata]